MVQIGGMLLYQNWFGRMLRGTVTKNFLQG